MPLTLPSAGDLQTYREDVSDADALQQAADLFFLATGLTEDPSTDFEKRLVQAAILEMAWSIQTRHEDLEESFSPFSSERIGSYSYSKGFYQKIEGGEPTGVPSFDRAVAYFMALALGGPAPFTDAEWVFAQGYTDADPRLIEQDPARSGTAPWFNVVDPDAVDEGEVLVLTTGSPIPPGTPDDTLIVFVDPTP